MHTNEKKMITSNTAIKPWQMTESRVAKLCRIGRVALLGARLVRVGHAVFKFAAPIQNRNAIGLGIDDDYFTVGQDGNGAAGLDVSPHSPAQLGAVDWRIGRIGILVHGGLIAQGSFAAA